MPRIITITMNPSLDLSTLVDRFVAGRKLRCGPARVDPGGGGINVSRVIRELGGESVRLATIGGHSGKALADLLREGGVTPRRIPMAGAMRRNLAIAERETGRQFRFVLPGPLVRGSEWRRALARIQGLLGRGDRLVESGSLPPGIPADF